MVIDVYNHHISKSVTKIIENRAYIIKISPIHHKMQILKLDWG